MRIESVEAIALSSDDPGFDQNPTREVLIVAIRADDGRVGYGECNHLLSAARAFLETRARQSVSAGVAPLLVGRTVEDPAAMSAELFEANYFSARRGVGKGVLAAVDQALWDLYAQSKGVPLYKLLWGDAAQAPLVYGTIYTGAVDWPKSIDVQATLIKSMLKQNYKALKVEPLIDCCPEEHIGEMVIAGRALLPADMPLLVDFGYRMPTCQRALRAIEAALPAKPYAIETPCQIDAFREWRALCARTPTPIAGAELLESVLEFQQLIDLGVEVLQPWPNRIGVSGTMEVIRLAQAARRKVILAGYNTTAIGIAVGLHIAAGLEGVAGEHASTKTYKFGLRAAAKPDFALGKDGRLPLPTAPGLGVTLDEAFVATHRV